jgi:hypothetical protein
VGAPLVALLDVTTGQDVWSTREGTLAQAEGVFFLPEGFLVSGKERDGGGRVWMLLDAADGTPRWVRRDPWRGWPPDVYGTGAQPPLLDSDDTMILFLNGGAIRKYDRRNGAMIWERKMPSPPDFDQPCAPTLRSGHAPMMLAPEGDCFFAPHLEAVGCFALADGRRLSWVDGLQGHVRQMQLLPEGLLVRLVRPYGEGEVHSLALLDLTGGRATWKSPHRLSLMRPKGWEDSTPFVVRDGRILVAADGRLFDIDLATGEERTLQELGEGRVASLEPLDGGYLATGTHAAVWCAADGVEYRRVAFEPPDGFGLGLLKLLGAAASDAVGVGTADYAGAFAAMGRDYAATASTASYVYFLAEAGADGPDLFRVRKSDGESAGRVPVRDEQPDYAICPHSGRVFLLRDDYLIECLEFE